MKTSCYTSRSISFASKLARGNISSQQNINVCPAATLQVYCDRTAAWKSSEIPGSQSHLFLRTKNSDLPVAIATVGLGGSNPQQALTHQSLKLTQ